MQTFLPDALDKEFIKRDSKYSLNNKQQDAISNSIDGFVSYFSAANIRNKIKNPIFLAIKFFNCLTLYYNEEMISPNQPLTKIVKDIQDVICKI